MHFENVILYSFVCVHYNATRIILITHDMFLSDYKSTYLRILHIKNKTNVLICTWSRKNQP